jgi:predicted deacetylase
VSVIVSIHDVTPALLPRVEALWALCRVRGVTPALLVVPNWHGAWPIAGNAAFLDWLSARAADGAEIVLHGERHDEVGLPRAFADEVRAVGRTNREGEFLTLELDAAAERIARGLALLRGAGLTPAGFVPPAWLMRPATIEACRRAGLPFTEDDGQIHLLGERVTALASPVVRWSGRAALRARLSVAVAEWRWRAQRTHPLVRIAYHPSDLDHPATARSAETILDRWLTVSRPARYGELVPATPVLASA